MLLRQHLLESHFILETANLLRNTSSQTAHNSLADFIKNPHRSECSVIRIELLDLMKIINRWSCRNETFEKDENGWQQPHCAVVWELCFSKFGPVNQLFFVKSVWWFQWTHTCFDEHRITSSWVISELQGWDQISTNDKSKRWTFKDALHLYLLTISYCMSSSGFYWAPFLV